MQEYVQTSPDRLVKLPKDINLTVAAFTEIVSVSYHAIDRFMNTAHNRRNVIGVWGDGNLENIVGEQVVVREMRDITKAFEMDIHKLIGKTVKVWDK